jgi:hypothetical protein
MTSAVDQLAEAPDTSRGLPVEIARVMGEWALSRDSGGPAPEGNGSTPVHDCDRCGAMWSGGGHTCRQAGREPELEAG